jgi:hypothetical protein
MSAPPPRPPRHGSAADRSRHTRGEVMTWLIVVFFAVLIFAFDPLVFATGTSTVPVASERAQSAQSR